MRRKDRQVNGMEEMHQIISRCQVCHLALSEPNGQPYALALNFGYQPGPAPTLYFHCARQGRKLDLIRANPKAAFILDRELGLTTGAMACDWGMDYESIMGSGIMTIVSDPQERKAGLDVIMAHYGNPSPDYSPQSLEHTTVLKLTIAEMTGKRRGGKA